MREEIFKRLNKCFQDVFGDETIIVNDNNDIMTNDQVNANQAINQCVDNVPVNANQTVNQRQNDKSSSGKEVFKNFKVMDEDVKRRVKIDNNML